MLKNKINKCIEWYYSLDGNKKLLVTIGAVILLIILVKLLSMINLKKGIIEYDWNSTEEFTSGLNCTNDRNIYAKSNEIVKRLIMTSNGEYYIKEKKVTISDWYNYIKFEEYNISKNKFKKIVENINDDFDLAISEYGSAELLYNSLIENIYVYSDSYKMYIVCLNINGNYHYVGIKYESDNSYSIFYLE